MRPMGVATLCTRLKFAWLPYVCITSQLWPASGGARSSIQLRTSRAITLVRSRYTMRGITRGHVLQLCAQLGIPAFEKDFSLAQVEGAAACSCYARGAWDVPAHATIMHAQAGNA